MNPYQLPETREPSRPLHLPRLLPWQWLLLAIALAQIPRLIEFFHSAAQSAE